MGARCLRCRALAAIGAVAGALVLGGCEWDSAGSHPLGQRAGTYAGAADVPLDDATRAELRERLRHQEF